MIKLPNFKKAWDYENDFLSSCENSRIAKILAHYELFKMASKKQGDFVICGVFRGISTIEFATFLELFNKESNRKTIVFDEFGKFPTKKLDLKTKTVIKQMGDSSITKNQLTTILNNKKIKNIELIKGRIPKSILEYITKKSKMKIALLNLDIDIYDKELKSLEILYPKISKGGILVLNDYGIFKHETKLIDKYFKDKNVKIQKLSFTKTPSFIIKK